MASRYYSRDGGDGKGREVCGVWEQEEASRQPVGGTGRERLTFSRHLLYTPFFMKESSEFV